GLSGTNAAVLLSEPPSSAATQAMTAPALVVLSGRTSAALRQSAENLHLALARAPGFLHDIAFTLQVGREPLDHRLAIVAKDLPELVRHLAGWLAGDADQLAVFEGRVKRGPGAPTLTSEAVLRAARRFLAGDTSLAALWAAGAPSPDWKALHPTGRPAR